MDICKIKDRSLRMIMDRLYCKTKVLENLKTFTHADWSKEIIRLTAEIGQIKMGFTDYEEGLWKRIMKKKTGK